MRSTLMWALHDGKQMHIVDSMAQAYVEEKKHPSWGIFLLDVPENGFWRIERGPLTIVRKGRLFGDRYMPVMDMVMMAAMFVGFGFLMSLAVTVESWFYGVFACALLALGVMFHFNSRREMRRSLHRMTSFMDQVRDLAGEDLANEVKTTLVGRTKGDGNGWQRQVN